MATNVERSAGFPRPDAAASSSSVTSGLDSFDASSARPVMVRVAGDGAEGGRLPEVTGCRHNGWADLYCMARVSIHIEPRGAVATARHYIRTDVRGPS